MPLADQQAEKREWLRAIARAIDLDGETPFHPSEPSWFHRAKAIWPVRRISGRVASGFYRAGTHDLVSIEECQTQDPVITLAQLAIRAAVEALGLSVYDERTDQGFVRAAFARLATGTSNLQVGLVTSGGEFEKARDFAKHVRRALDGARTAKGRRIQLQSVVRNLNDAPGNTLLGPRTVPLLGSDYIDERLGRLSLRLRMTSFFQVNPYAAIALYRGLERIIAPLSAQRTLECYAGVGTISLWCRRHLGEVFVIESEPSAYRDARENFERNDLDPAKVLAGRVEERLRDVPDPLDLVIVDPPRAGLDEVVRRTLVERRPRAIAYVSCSRKTFLRDARDLGNAGYRALCLEGYDLFPHTEHLETLALFALE